MTTIRKSAIYAAAAVAAAAFAGGGGEGGGSVAWSAITSKPASLSAIAGVTPEADTIAYFTGSAAAESTPLTSVGRSLIGAADAAEALDLIQPATTKGQILVHNGTGLVALNVGTNGQVLKANSATATGLEWGTDLNSGGSSTSPLTTKGDIWVFGSSDTRLAVGTNGQVLSSNSAQASGLQWITPYSDPLTTNGDIVVRLGGVTTRLAVGSEGQVLKVTSGLPAWGTDSTGAGSSLPSEGSDGNFLQVVGGTWTSAAFPASAVSNMSITWNMGTTVAYGIKLDVTDTASNANSFLIHTSTGGTPRFTVDKTGKIWGSDITVGTGSVAYLGFYGFKITSSGYLGFAPTTTSINGSSASPDTAFYRASAGVMSLRGSTTTSGAYFNFYNGTVPATPGASQVVLGARDNGGVQEMVARFANGTIVTFASASGSSGGYIDPLTTDGDLVYRIGGVTTRLPKGVDGQVLTMVAGAVAWDDVPVGSGGTSPTTTLGDMIYRGASEDQRLAIGSEGSILKVVSGVPSWVADSTISIDNMSVTWNNAGTVFSAIKMNVTDVASQYDSYFLDMRVGGIIRFSVTKNGAIMSGAGGLTISSTGYGYLGYLGLKMNKDAFIGFASGGTGVNGSTAGPDTAFYRDGAGVMALRNSTNAQAIRVYYTRTDDSNHQRLALNTAAAYVEVAAETAGTGADNIDLKLTPAGTGVVQFGTHSAVAAETVTGYITVKDAAGNSRKLAVLS